MKPIATHPPGKEPDPCLLPKLPAIAAILAKYAPQRKLYAALRRPPNPDLNTGYIRRKWLNVPYAAGCPRALMDIYLPNDGDGPFPVILFAHGGGYFTGARTTMRPIRRWKD